MTDVLPRPEEKATTVRRMFDGIAPRYDRMNRLLTGGMDQRWRRRLIERVAIRPGDVVLDLASGTGDLAALARRRARRVYALDFSRGMLDVARGRLRRDIALVQGDALRLPLRDASIDVAVSGFALRNFTAIAPVMAELARVVRRGGRIGFVEVDRPRNGAIRRGHALYFDRVVPFVGGLLSDRKAYAYLPKSTVYLPPERELLDLVVAAGFREVRKQSPLLGAIQLITAVRA
jgi:demethylmenaquinone methyltransferase/2-methoxy-6-polyprenyl-1,4-benzoquinol methylase